MIKTVRFIQILADRPYLYGLDKAGQIWRSSDQGWTPMPMEANPKFLELINRTYEIS